jgi:hypothetical protein
MKIIYSWLFLCYLVAGIAYTAAAQQCGSVPYQDMLYQFPTWNWEVPPVLPGNSVNPQYCKTWAVRRVNDGRTDALVINAPWVGASNGVLLRIANNQDYTKAKGWELLRMNLGGATAVVVPHFILYNKYTGIIRTFFYLDNSGGTYTNGAFVTMSHSSANGGNSSGILALANKKILTPEKYLSSSDNDDEIITYVTKLTSTLGGWIVADFPAGYDPNSTNPRYSSASLEFAVQGVTTSNLTIAGDFVFTTDKQDGYGFAGKKAAVVTDDPVKRIKTYLATGQKVLGVVDKVDEFAKKFAASSLVTSSNSSAVGHLAGTEQAGTIASNNASTASTAGPSFLKTILNTASGFNAAFGVLGSVMGLIWPDAGGSSFTPTVSNGSLTLTGTITTTYPLFSLSMRVPGTPHPYDGSTQTYYDCALGLFTIKNTPVLTRANTMVYPPYSAPLRWSSYQVSNDLVAAYNEAAGLTLQSVQAAIVIKQTKSSDYDIGGDEMFRQQLASGEIIIVASDDSTITYQTPFIGLGNFKFQSITTAHTSGTSGVASNDAAYRISIRIAAMLQRKNAAPGAAPILYVQDYAPQIVSGAGKPNPNYGDFTIRPIQRVFDNLASVLVGVRKAPNLYPPFNYFLAGTPDPYYASTTPPTANTVFSSPITISSAYNILLTPSDYSTVIDHPNKGTSYLLASNNIDLGNTFAVTPNTEVVISTSLQAWKDVGTPAFTESNGTQQCAYNAVAYRMAAPEPVKPESTPVEALAIYPNPTHGQFSVTTNDLSGGTLTIYDALGKIVKRIKVAPLNSHTYQVDLAGRGVGFYVVRLETATTTTSKKLLVE